MGLLEAIGKRVLARRLERMRRELEGGTMKVSPGFKVALVGAVLLILHAIVEASQNYFKVDVTPTTAEWGRAVATAAIGAFLYWLRSPKDEPPPQ